MLWRNLALVAAAAAAAGAMAPVRGAQNAADHPEQYAPADVAAGAQIYARNCTSCHGLNGTGIGGIDLGRGLLPRAGTDAALQALVTTGIPQSGMPAFKFTADELRTLVAYVRAGLAATDAAPVPMGDAARGRAVFEGKGNCLSCHRVVDKGSFAAPDLTDIGRARVPSSIRRSLIDPSASMRPINRPVRAVTRDGRTITGRRLNEDTYTVQLMTDQGRLVSLVKSELRELTVGMTSPMPSYKDTVTESELADLVAYLVSLKG
jgi:putative heme-binding domain-containing protein